MNVYIGADHGGFAIKEQLKEQLRSHGMEVVDMGAEVFDSEDDYPVYGRAVAEAVQADEGSRGLALCRSGHGMVMTANKVDGVRAILATPDEAWNVQAVEHDAANVLAIGVDYLNERQLLPLVLAWLKAEFVGGRHQRRLDQLTTLERERHLT
jgi:ribose 5-phosphate isomerase B